jgi:hypothetical protein
MSQMRYFATCNGKPVQLESVYHSGQYTRAKDFAGICPACGGKHVCERKIEYKANPSKHQCDARCMRATGKIMRCECSCGGMNHGKGSAA